VTAALSGMLEVRQGLGLLTCFFFFVLSDLAAPGSSDHSTQRHAGGKLGLQGWKVCEPGIAKSRGYSTCLAVEFCTPLVCTRAWHTTMLSLTT
jgi:hypothetical protein